MRPALFFIWLGLLTAPANAQLGPVDFDRDIRPILSDRCYPCHGPDAAAREADLRLDTAEGAFATRDGTTAFHPGVPEQSEAILRIFSDDAEQRMPPPSSKLVLSERERAMMRQWVAEGARWGQHWAFVPPVMPRLPAVANVTWPRNAIDHFVLARLEQEGLRPSPEASRETLIRRLTLDLTGLPPTLAEVDAFLADERPDAYERAVDRLLASPRYGERMAWEWLEAARYADTDGFQGDPTRSMWPWRDWLVASLNANQPFDQFTIETLAGDLLPGATERQIIATGFNRNHMYNGEGGRIPEETRVENVFDRTETTSTVWLGLTMTCARCHDHKFDPISQREYYQLYAFFNNTSESGRGGGGKAPPVFEHYSPAQQRQLAQYDLRIAELTRCLEAPIPEVDRAQSEAEPQLRQRLDEELKQLQQQRGEIKAAPVMVMDELPAEQRRKTSVLLRGTYNQPQTEVTEGTPAFLPSLPAEAPRNRLTLARWLVDVANPLTARVAVNRQWQLFFGSGIVQTSEDFGRQGSRPSHPQLLDWLATQFMQRGWDVKAMHRLIVSSATYRQSSGYLPKHLAETSSESSSAAAEDLSATDDPDNRRLTRSSRARMPAWMLRDQALALSGLLVSEIGGPAVKPYQPSGVWADATFGKILYEQDHGASLYRASLYIFWRRIVGPTMFFDGGKRQDCVVRSGRTNTPLHALTTLNDATYVEASRAMAERIMRADAEHVEARLAQAFRMATARHPNPSELAVLARRWKKLREEFSNHPEEANALLAIGESPRDESLDSAEHAAYSVICSLILNLDEVLTRE